MGLLEYKFEIENASHQEISAIMTISSLILVLGHRLGTTTFMTMRDAQRAVACANREQMTLNVITDRKREVVLVLLNRIGSPCVAKFAHALRKTPLHLAGMAIARMFFEMSDNVVFAPVFWYGIPEECKMAVVNMHARSIVNQEDTPPADALVPNYKTDHPFALDVRSVRLL